MPITRPSVKVLRFWYRISTFSEVRALPHPAFRWLYGIVMAWTGYNNGAIEFTRRRHGSLYGLDNPGVFERARKDVLDTGLVMMTQAGGNSVPAKYALVNQPMQVNIRVGISKVPSKQKKDGIAEIPSDAKSGTSQIPSRYLSDTVKTAPYRRSRSRLNKKLICKPHADVLTEPQVAIAPNPDAGQGGDVQIEAHVGNGGIVLPLASEALTHGEPT